MSPGDLETLLNQKHPWMLSWARSLCRARVDAEDLVQEAFARFLVAFGDAPQLPAERVCVAWLVSTMTRCFISQLRRRRAWERNMADPVLCQDSCELAEPSTSEQVTDAQLCEAVQALSPRLREMVTMRIQGRKYQAIARELGVSAGGVGRQLHQARAILRGVLESMIRGPRTSGRRRPAPPGWASRRRRAGRRP